MADLSELRKNLIEMDMSELETLLSRIRSSRTARVEKERKPKVSKSTTPANLINQMSQEDKLRLLRDLGGME